MSKITDITVPIQITEISGSDTVDITPVMSNISLLAGNLGQLITDVNKISLSDTGINMTSPHTGNLNTYLTTLKSNITSNTQSINSMNNKFVDTAINVSSKSQKLNVVLADLESKIESKQLNDLGVKMTTPYSGTLHSKISNMDEKIKELEVASGKIELVDTTIDLSGSHTGSKLNTWISAIDNSVNTANSNISSNSNSIATNTRDISTINGNIKSINETTARTSASLSDLEVTVSTMNSKVNNADTRSRTNATNISDLTSRVSTLETNITGISTKLNTANDNLRNLIG